METEMNRKGSSVSTSASEATKTAPPYDVRPNSYVPAYKVLFSGPDNLRHQKVTVQSTSFQYTGENMRSGEVTEGLAYLNRPAPGAKFPLAKNGRLGEIGGEVEYFGIVKGL